MNTVPDLKVEPQSQRINQNIKWNDRMYTHYVWVSTTAQHEEDCTANWATNMLKGQRKQPFEQHPGPLATFHLGKADKSP